MRTGRELQRLVRELADRVSERWLALYVGVSNASVLVLGRARAYRKRFLAWLSPANPWEDREPEAEDPPPAEPESPDDEDVA